MEASPRKKEDFVSWATDKNWLLVLTAQTPEGYQQENYLTPEGKVVFIVYNSDDTVRFAMPMPAPLQATQMSPRLPPDFPGLRGGFPPLGRG